MGLAFYPKSFPSLHSHRRVGCRCSSTGWWAEFASQSRDAARTAGRQREDLPRSWSSVDASTKWLPGASVLPPSLFPIELSVYWNNLMYMKKNTFGAIRPGSGRKTSLSLNNIALWQSVPKTYNLYNYNLLAQLDKLLSSILWYIWVVIRPYFPQK